MNEKQKYIPGTILQDYETKSYWLVLTPNEFYPIKPNSVANLFDGQVQHVDWLREPKQVTHLEIMW